MSTVRTGSCCGGRQFGMSNRSGRRRRRRTPFCWTKSVDFELAYQLPAQRGSAWVNAWDSAEPPQLVRIRIAFVQKDARRWPELVAAPKSRPNALMRAIRHWPHNERERGFALLIVLWTLSLLALGIAHVATTGRREAEIALNLSASAERQAVVDGAVFEAAFRVLDHGGRHWEADGVHRSPRSGAGVSSRWWMTRRTS